MEWISVEDRLPAWIGGPPVICGFPGNRFEEEWTDAAVLSNGHRWVNVYGCEIFPTHWMPLPSPPERTEP